MRYEYAPIAIFAYNRPHHFERLLKSLLTNSEANHSHLYIFIDGPKSENDVFLVNETRSIATNVTGFANVSIDFSTINRGLATSIRRGIDLVLAENECVIVLEDDLLLASGFLKFMNLGLNRYYDTKEVASIHGYIYDLQVDLQDPFFLQGADCWGWATWKDRWQAVLWDPRQLLNGLIREELLNRFDLDGSHSFSTALKNEIRQQNRSWAIYWHASMFLQRRLTLFPNKSLVQYCGADGSGTHGVGNSDFLNVSLSTETSWKFPNDVGESQAARDALIAHHRKYFPRLSPLGRLLRKIQFVLHSERHTD
jgi:hypothetical protein